MPEVVYPTPDENGKAREWKNMFPELPDHHLGWEAINSTLECIAMNNRFGTRTVEEVREKLLADLIPQVENLIKRNSAVKDEEKYNAYMKEYGMWVWYTNKVFDNLGGAYREYK